MKKKNWRVPPSITPQFEIDELFNLIPKQEISIHRKTLIQKYENKKLFIPKI